MNDFLVAAIGEERIVGGGLKKQNKKNLKYI